jgi:hypothetical protein
MNTFEVSILIADLTILIAGFAIFNHFNKRQKRQDKIIASMNEKIFEVESSQRYERKFEISELKNKQDDFKNKQELLEVKISKAQFDFEQVYETLAKSILKTMSINKVEQEGTKPSDSVKNEVVDLIKKEKTPSTTTRVYNKSNITPIDIENAFREKFKMTYYGYREKYGEEALVKAKDNAYQRAYYLKVEKKKLITKK